MENRFLEMDAHLKHGRTMRGMRPAKRGSQQSQAQSLRLSQSYGTYARSFSADQRALVILIENGGVDLGIPELADKLISALPDVIQVPESMRQQLIVFLRDKIKELTDTLLESAELALNRYSSAAPDFFGSVSVLRNGTATYDDLKGKLSSLSKEGKLIDLFVLTHGSHNEIAVAAGSRATRSGRCGPSTANRCRSAVCT